MKKLSKIIESIWSDIQDRSSGDVVRKEDNVNNMNLDELAEYIHDCYGKNNIPRIYIDQRQNFISIDEIWDGHKTKQLLLVFDWDSLDDKVIQLPYSFMEKYEDTFKKMENVFSLDYKKPKDENEYDELMNISFINIHPKNGGKNTNAFFIEVLDFIYKSFNTGLTESIWSDIQDRSAGETIRKEDDINNLDCEELRDYIIQKYNFKCSIEKDIDAYEYSMMIPIFEYKGGWTYLKYNSAKHYIVLDVKYIEEIGNLRKILTSNYDIYIDDDKSLPNWTTINISPTNGGKIDNKFCLDVIEKLVDSIDLLTVIGKNKKKEKIHKIIEKK